MGSRNTKKAHQSKKILPRDPPKIVAVKAPSNPGDSPKSVLAEFRKGVSGPLNLVPTPKGDAPHVPQFVCTAAWRVQQDPLKQDEFNRVTHELGSVVTLYHGTPARNVTEIARDGLRPGRKYCMFGSGIYLGSPQKAMGYTGIGWARSEGAQAAYLFKVQAALGQILEAKEPHKYSLGQIRQMGYDSVAGLAGWTASFGGTLRHSENVIYSPDQAMVLKVFEYQPLQHTLDKTTEALTGPCGLMKTVNIPLNYKNRAFKDIINVRQCGADASVKVNTDNIPVWLCNKCLSTFRLKVGSRITIRDPYGKKIDARIKSVR